MIPQKFVDFVQGPTLHFVGSRNAKLRPAFTWAFGATVDAAQGTITFYVPNVEGAETLSNFDDNGMVALTVSTPPRTKPTSSRDLASRCGPAKTGTPPFRRFTKAN